MNPKHIRGLSSMWVDPVSQEKSIQRQIVRMITVRSFALVVLLGVAWQAQAQDAKTPYPSMAPLEQYLIADRNAEIALARSAAPESISRDAEVMVLGRHGYETAVKGKNGFVCMVERSWTAGIDNPDFWNPKLRGPLCLNAPAARSYLPLTIKKTELVLAGQSKDSNGRQHESRFRQEGIADAGTWRDVLHAVKARVLERSRRALASAPDVFRSANGGCNLGRRPARFADFGI